MIGGFRFAVSMFGRYFLRFILDLRISFGSFAVFGWGNLFGSFDIWLGSG
jgi:hypothetical protein